MTWKAAIDRFEASFFAASTALVVGMFGGLTTSGLLTDDPIKAVLFPAVAVLAWPFALLAALAVAWPWPWLLLAAFVWLAGDAVLLQQRWLRDWHYILLGVLGGMPLTVSCLVQPDWVHRLPLSLLGAAAISGGAVGGLVFGRVRRAARSRS